MCFLKPMCRRIKSFLCGRKFIQKICLKKSIKQENFGFIMECSPKDEREISIVDVDYLSMSESSSSSCSLGRIDLSFDNEFDVL